MLRTQNTIIQNYVVCNRFVATVWTTAVYRVAICSEIINPSVPTQP